MNLDRLITANGIAYLVRCRFLIKEKERNTKFRSLEIGASDTQVQIEKRDGRLVSQLETHRGSQCAPPEAGKNGKFPDLIDSNRGGSYVVGHITRYEKNQPHREPKQR